MHNLSKKIKITITAATIVDCGIPCAAIAL